MVAESPLDAEQHPKDVLVLPGWHRFERKFFSFSSKCDSYFLPLLIIDFSFCMFEATDVGSFFSTAVGLIISGSWLVLLTKLAPMFNLSDPENVEPGSVSTL